ncbi:hypothetical protein D9M71_179080 [compost metagenome]
MALGRPQQQEAGCTDQQSQAHVPATFQAFIRATCQQVHAEKCQQIGQAGQQADGFQVLHAEAANQRGHPIGHRVRTAVDAKEHGPCNVYPGVAQHLGQAGSGRVRRPALFQRCGEHVFLLLGQPACICRFVHQPEPAKHPQQHGRDAFHDEQNLPVLEPQPTVEVGHDRACQRPADNSGDHCCHQEYGGDSRTQRRREPIGQVQDDPGEKSGLGYAQDKSCEDQLIGRGDEGGGHRDHAP